MSWAFTIHISLRLLVFQTPIRIAHWAMLTSSEGFPSSTFQTLSHASWRANGQVYHSSSPTSQYQCSVSVTVLLLWQTQGLKGWFWLTVQGMDCRETMTAGAWGNLVTQQSVRKQREVKAHSWLTFSLLLSLGPQPMEWCWLQLGGSYHLSQSNLDNPSQACPEAGHLGESRSCQVGNISLMTVRLWLILYFVLNHRIHRFSESTGNSFSTVASAVPDFWTIRIQSSLTGTTNQIQLPC